jgi:hypothetical protein
MMRTIGLLLALTLLPMLTTPAHADAPQAQEMIEIPTPPAPPAPSPQPYRALMLDVPEHTERNWGLFSGGIILFSTTWTATIVPGTIFAPIFEIPIAGPIWAATGSPPWVSFLLVSDAIAQASGLAMMIAGAATHKTVPAKRQLTLVPLAAGVALRGTF